MTPLLAVMLSLLIVEATVPSRKTPKNDPAELALMKTLNPHAAGIDVGARETWVAVPEGSVPDRRAGRCDELPARVRCFGTCTAELRRLAEWLRSAKVDAVALESTGVYWIALYDLLEAEGFRVMLVDPHQTRAAPGRPKTDVKDCMWIQRLHSLGLLSAAFRPDEPIRVWRGYQRHRASLVEDASRFILRMQKALEQMNVKLTEVLRDVTGVTGLAIIRSILAGERDPKKLAELRQAGCKHSQAAIARALEGTWQAEHLFALAQSLSLYEYYQQKIRECDAAIEKHLEGMALPARPEPMPARDKARSSLRKNDPHFEARQKLYAMCGVDLTAIEGTEANTALVVLSEIGTDMSRWRSDRAFGAWLGLSPNPKKTGGKLKSARTRGGVNRAAQALRLAARNLHRSKSALGAFFRRIAARRGVPRAITATAYKLARIVYAMLKHGEAYVKTSLEQYEQEYRERRLKQLKSKAAEMGYELTQRQAEAGAGVG
jgi:transposase